ncbi:MAG: hypothetical protein HY242_08530 [Afipia sp.]|nr:hypothetical protein [Afipia sp.]
MQALSATYRGLLAIGILGGSINIGEAAAPKQLYNKTFSFFWGESNRSIRVSDGADTTGNFKLDRMIYFSTAGRHFSRGSYSTQGISIGGSRELAPGDNAMGITFEGNSFRATWHAFGSTGVARSLTVNYDPAVTSCSASISVGKVGDGTSVGIDGARYRLVETNVGSVSCSVKDGNPY